MLSNKNTIESFKGTDKQMMLNQCGAKIWNAIKTGDALKEPELLTQFTLLTFAVMRFLHILSAYFRLNEVSYFPYAGSEKIPILLLVRVSCFSLPFQIQFSGNSENIGPGSNSRRGTYQCINTIKPHHYIWHYYRLLSLKVHMMTSTLLPATVCF